MLPAWIHSCGVRHGKTSHVNAKRRDATDDMTPRFLIPVVALLVITIVIISTLLSRYIGESIDSTGELQLTYLPSRRREIVRFWPHDFRQLVGLRLDVSRPAGVSFASYDSNTTVNVAMS